MEKLYGELIMCIIKENILHCHSLYTKCIMNESCLHHVTLDA